jgi:hypothetical protein
MSDIVKTLLSMGITVGLSDREGFVHEFSGIIQKYQQDPEVAKKWAGGVAEYLETVKTNINMEKVFKNAFSGASFADKKQIESLTIAIEELTKELQKQHPDK